MQILSRELGIPEEQVLFEEQEHRYYTEKLKGEVRENEDIKI